MSFWLALGMGAAKVASTYASIRASKQQRKDIKEAQLLNEAQLRNKKTLDLNRLQNMGRRNRSAIRASVAKSGVTMSGSSLLALRESAENAALDQIALTQGIDSQIVSSRRDANARIRAMKLQSVADTLAGITSSVQQFSASK